jgi:hypothetical protein
MSTYHTKDIIPSHPKSYTIHRDHSIMGLISRKNIQKKTPATTAGRSMPKARLVSRSAGAAAVTTPPGAVVGVLGVGWLGVGVV